MYRGVYFDTKRMRWRFKLWDGHRFRYGHASDEGGAAEARNQMIRELGLPASQLNEIEEDDVYG